MRDTRQVRARISFTRTHPLQVTAETKHEWNQTRLDRILVDYLLREVGAQ